MLILGLIYISQTFFLEDSYKKNKIASIENIGNKVASNIGNSKLEEIIKSISLEEEICIRVVSNEMDIKDNACPLSKFDYKEISDIAYIIKENDGRKLFDDYRMKDLKRDDLYVYGELTKYKNNDVLVLVSTLVRPISATEKAIQSQYHIIVIIVIVMTIALAFIFSKLLLKPINKIKKEATNLSKGNYDGSHIKPNNLEINELNNTLEKANEEILKADKAKKELIGNVSHDLRTPLTMIIGYAEMIKDMPDEDVTKNADTIIEEAKRLSSLVDDLVDISNYETKNIEFNMQEISIRNLLEDVYNQYKHYCDIQNVEFTLMLNEDIRTIADEKRLKQVLYNFMNNALNYNDKDDKTIELGLKKVNDKYRIYVRDNGNGIKNEDIEKIWDRYYKVDKNHKRHHLGSGIGLALSKSILEGMHLHFGVESVYNEFSEFYFDIDKYN